MPAITIFCHGTKSYSDEAFLDPAVEADGELVRVLERNFRIPTADQELTLNGGKLLLQGVGSGVDPRHSVLKESGDELGSVDKHRLAPAWGLAVSSLLHMVDGAGIGANIERALTFLDAMKREGMAPDAIVMVGWSRGAVTCVRLAQALDRVMPDIPVHIFAGDPVPGFGRHDFWKDAFTSSKEYTVTANVRTFLHIMAMDLKGLVGKAFRPLLPSKVDGSATKIGILPMPGNHSEVVKTSAGDPGKLTMDLAIRFLGLFQDINLRRDFLETYKLQMESILDYYYSLMEEVGKQDSHYASSHAFQETGSGGRSKYFVGKTPYYGSDFVSDFREKRFVNFHHRYIAERLGLVDTHHSADQQEGFELRQLLSEMYS